MSIGDTLAHIGSREDIIKRAHQRRKEESRRNSERLRAINEEEARDLALLDQIEALHSASEKPEWRLQQEANRTWSVYHGMGFRKGGFRERHEAQYWMDDYRSRMAEVGA